MPWVPTTVDAVSDDRDDQLEEARVPAGLHPGAAYRLHPQVAVRPEPFGALVYHYGNRKLVFLKSPRMVAIVRSLDGTSSVTDVLRRNGVPVDREHRFVDALSTLLRSDMIVAACEVSSERVPADAR